MNTSDKESKRIGIKEILGGLGLGGVVSFLTVQPFRIERITALKNQIADITARITEEFEKTKPTARDVLEMDDEGLIGTLSRWGAQKQDKIHLETVSLNAERRGLHPLWDGTRTAYSQLSASQKILVYAAGITTMIGGVIAINHWRNRESKKEVPHNKILPENRNITVPEPIGPFTAAENTRRSAMAEQRVLDL